jgi:hypothetical protein
MKLYTEREITESLESMGLELMVNEFFQISEPIQLPSDEEIIGRFMNWFLKHYSTATIDGMFGYVNSMEQEVTIREILNHYFNKEQILNQNI